MSLVCYLMGEGDVYLPMLEHHKLPDNNQTLAAGCVDFGKLEDALVDEFFERIQIDFSNPLIVLAIEHLAITNGAFDSHFDDG